MACQCMRLQQERACALLHRCQQQTLATGLQSCRADGCTAPPGPAPSWLALAADQCPESAPAPACLHRQPGGRPQAPAWRLALHNLPARLAEMRVQEQQEEVFGEAEQLSGSLVNVQMPGEQVAEHDQHVHASRLAAGAASSTAACSSWCGQQGLAAFPMLVVFWMHAQQHVGPQGP